MAVAVMRVRRGALVALMMSALGVFGFGATNDAAAQTSGNPPTRDDLVVDVRIVGNQAVALQRIGSYISTRAGRNYDPDIIEEDVRKLTQSRLFVSVNTSYIRSPEGVIVLFQFVERPTLRYVRYVGGTLRRSTLEKQSGLKVGDAVDPYLVEEARRKLEDYYKSKGYAKARVNITEGNKPGDRGAVFQIHEGPKQRIYGVEFEGNTIADDARLKTLVSSKPPILYLFKGELDEKKIDEDVEKLTAYYRGLGFFSARISREIELGESGNWATLRFVIDEGPRYRVRNVSVVGAKKFPAAELEEQLQLKGGKFFDQDAMTRDVGELQDRYGMIGYVYCNVQADPRFLETPGELDLIYQVEEGARYRVARIDVQIDGDDPHTRINTVLNRVELRPGDIVDIRKIRDSERRLNASGLFQTNPTQGNPPKISFHPLEDETLTAAQPGEPGGYRGQSPDGYAVGEPVDRPVVIKFWRRMLPGLSPEAALPLLGEWVAAEASTAPLEPTAVRFQSPWQPATSGGFGSADGQGYGQVSLGATAPGSNVNHAASYGPPPGGYVTPVQYTSPAAGGSAAPGPVYSGPPTLPSAQPAPVYAAPSVPPAYAAPPSHFQPTPSPYMGNAPGIGAPPLSAPSAGYGSGGELFDRQPPPTFPNEEPTQPLVLVPTVEEAQTGRFMLGVGVNSNAGLLGNIILDEQNADITRLPTSWRDFIEGRAFRGAGQQVRIEAVPGTQVSRYSFIFRQPYLFDTRVQFGLSGYYFQRYYRDWLEERLGGRVSLGYQFPYVPDLSVNTALRMEQVNLSDPAVPTPPQLASALGNSGLFVWENALVHDTRDNTFLATQGHRISLGFDQAFGTYDFSRGTIEARQHFLLHERPDRSGRQVLTLMSQFGITGSHTPIYENYFAGGFSSLRGFNFRGVGPYVGAVNVGGRFQWLNTVEYMFPISADDMVRGVLFCDFGTVENSLGIHADQFRVAPGFGLRLTVPAMGPAPIALDFAVPVAHAPGDNIQNFAFYVGFGR